MVWAVEPPFVLPPQSEINKIRSAIIETSQGEMRFELFPEDAPWHVANFKYLADKGFYRNLRFTIFFPDYIIQGGEPRNGKKGPGYSLPPEFSKQSHEEGTLGMARSENVMNPERRSNGSQFHILLAPAPHMDGSYSVFGKLVKGAGVLKRLRQGDTIIDVKVYIRPERK